MDSPRCGLALWQVWAPSFSNFILVDPRSPKCGFLWLKMANANNKDRGRQKDDAKARQAPLALLHCARGDSINSPTHTPSRGIARSQCSVARRSLLWSPSLAAGRKFRPFQSGKALDLWSFTSVIAAFLEPATVGQRAQARGTWPAVRRPQVEALTRRRCRYRAASPCVTMFAHVHTTSCACGSAAPMLF